MDKNSVAQLFENLKLQASPSEGWGPTIKEIYSPEAEEMTQQLPRFPFDKYQSFVGDCLDFLTPNGFECRLSDMNSYYQRIMLTLNLMDQRERVRFEPKDIRRHDLCMVNLNGGFHRAQVELCSLSCHQSCTVYLVDEARFKVVSKNQVFKLPDSATDVPSTSFIFQLEHIPDQLSHYYSKHLNNFFESFCSDGNNTLEVIFQ